MATQKERAVIDLVINGEQSKTSLKEVTKATIDARKELNKLREADNPQLYKQKLADYKALNTAQREMAQRVNETAKAHKSWQSSALDMAKGVLGGNLAMAGINTLIGLIPAATQKSMALKDQLADIAKTADLTDQEVAGLNESLKRIDTRTPTKELRAMAEIGGQFGVAKDKVDEFVEGTNMANVAIGKAFGNVEAMTTEVMGLRNVFQGIKTDDPGADILHISNALNVLETQGAATAPVMTDFASRMGGVLVPLGLTEGQVLGLSSTLQELNVTAERGATATVNIVQSMLSETATFAKVAGVPLKEYKDLIQKDIYGALLKYLEGLKKVQPNQLEFQKVLDASKLTGAGALEVLSKLSVNQELLAQRTDQATTALKGIDSITAEYNKKNYDMAVNMKRLGEVFDDWLANGWLAKFGGWLAGAAVSVLGLRDNLKKVTDEAIQQRAEVDKLEKGLNPLISRYETLKGKASLTKDEQIELRKTVSQIAEVVPIAVSEWDKYGNALSINTTKAREFIAVQQAMLKHKNQDAIDDVNKSLTGWRRQYAEVDQMIRSGKKTTFDEGIAATINLSNEEMQAALQRRKEIGQQIIENKRLLSGLTGSYLDEPAKPAKPAGATPATGGTIDGIESKEEKAAGKKQDRLEKQQQRHDNRMADLMAAARQRTAKDQEDEFLKEQLAFGEHYSELYSLAAGNKEQMAQVTELMYQELAAIEQKEAARKQKQQEKEAKEKQEARKKEIDDAVAHLENIHDLEAAQQLVAYSDPESRRLKELQLEQQFLQAKKLLLEEYQMETGEVERQITDNLFKQNELRKESARETADQIRQAYREQQQYIREALGQGLGLMKENWTGVLAGYKQFWKEATLVQKAALIAEKAYAVAQIAINLQRQLSAINTAAAIADSFLPGSGTVIRTKGYIMAIGKAALNAASVMAVGVNSPGFIEGGYTDDPSGQPGGYYSKPTYFSKRNYRVAEDGRPEYVVSNPMLRNPVVANTVRALEALRRGGSTAALTQAQPAGSAGAPVDVTLLVQEMRALRSDMQAVANRPVKAQFNYHAFKDETDRVLDIRSDTSL